MADRPESNAAMPSSSHQGHTETQQTDDANNPPLVIHGFPYHMADKKKYTYDLCYKSPAGEITTRKFCRFFLGGVCTRGDECRYEHAYEFANAATLAAQLDYIISTLNSQELSQPQQRTTNRGRSNDRQSQSNQRGRRRSKSTQRRDFSSRVMSDNTVVRAPPKTKDNRSRD